MVKQPTKEIEFHPDAMERFERAAKVVAKSPPQHRVTKKKATAKKKKPSRKP
ncbi:hypothetical protein RAD15_41635 [Bradyrhizobium sp. 14AA]